MIHEGLSYIRRELRDQIPSVTDAEVMLKGLNISAENNNSHGIYITFVNVEKFDNDQRNTDHPVANFPGPLRPEIPKKPITILVLFSFKLQSYKASLSCLSKTIELFNSKSIFTSETASNTNPFPIGMDFLRFIPYPMKLEELNYLCGIIGRTYVPSILYRMKIKPSD